MVIYDDHCFLLSRKVNISLFCRSYTKYDHGQHDSCDLMDFTSNTLMRFTKINIKMLFLLRVFATKLSHYTVD